MLRNCSPIAAFLQEHHVKSAATVDKIIGCPHEEGIDYPEGKPCPQCSFWAGRNRFTHEGIKEKTAATELGVVRPLVLDCHGS
jgi:hypothetical protein